MGKLDGKVAVVTGATAGIGAGVVRVFLKHGAKVVFCGRRAEKGKRIQEDLRAQGYAAAFVQADMTKDADVDCLAQEAVAAYGHVDVLVNNAGIMRSFQILDMDMDRDYGQVMDLNLRSYVYATKVFGNLMKDHGGSIVNMASVGGLGASPTLSSYAMSKAAVISFTKTAAKELAALGIRVNAILPGTIFSEMMPRDGKFTEYTLSLIPMKRGGEPEEIGEAAAFLASDEASYMTGAQVVVDGGISL